ncbi:MAG: alpha/beta hydrolase [Thermodesulfobacteriota bacterium]
MWITGGDVRLYASELAVGRDPTLLVLHGYGDSHAAWRDTVAAIEPAHRTIALDSRGHGESGWPPSGDYSLAAMADDVRRAVTMLGLERVVLAGHSTGGMTALALAAAEPRMALALALLDVDPFVFKDGLERLPAYTGCETAATLDELGGLDHAALGPDEHARRLRRLRALARRDERGRWMWKQDPRLRPSRARQPLRPCDDATVRAMLAELSCATLLLYGERSAAVSRAALEQSARLIAGRVTIRGVADAGHALLADAPLAIADALSKLLGSLATPAST